MKRTLSFVLAVVFMISCFLILPVGAEEKPVPYSGTPAERWFDKKERSIEVGTAEQLVGLFWDMAENGNNYERRTITLTADIVINEGDFSRWESEPPKYNWKEIAANGEFRGIFDGNGHSISGIYANGFYDGKDHMPFSDYKLGHAAKHYVGFFSKLGGTVKNLRITNSYFCGPYGTSALAGSLTDEITVENVQIDNTKVYGSYAETADPKMADELDVSGPYEKHSATGAFVGLAGFRKVNDRYVSVSLTNCIFRGEVVSGGRFSGGLVGSVSDAYLKMKGCGFIGSFTSEYQKNYDGVNLFKETTGGLVGWARITDSAKKETALAMEDCFYIGTFAPNPKSTYSGVFLGRSTLFSAENCYASQGSYDKLYDPTRTEISGGEEGMQWMDSSVLTGKSSVEAMKLDKAVFSSVEGVGPQLKMFVPQAPVTADLSFYPVAALLVSVLVAAGMIRKNQA